MKNKSKVKLPRGEGSVFYSERRGKYVAQFNVKIDDKVKRRTFYGDTEIEVIRKMENERELVKQGIYSIKDKITLFDLGMEIIARERQMNYIKPTTYDRKYETLKSMELIHDIPVQKIKESDIYALLISITHYSQSLINKVYQMLNCIFREAVKRRILSSNPMDSIDKPRTSQDFEKVRALTVPEQRKLIEVLLSEDILYSLQMLVSMFTGMRMGEINALEVKDIDFAKDRIYINKTISRSDHGCTVLSRSTKTKAGRRVIPISGEIADLLKEYIGQQKDGFVFSSNSGNYVTTNQVNYQFKKTVEKYHIIDNSIDGKVTLHSLRHTYATRCIESGMSAKVLQSLLGHTDISITLDTYCDVFNEFSNDNVAVVNNYMKDNNLTIVTPKIAIQNATPSDFA